MGQDPKVVPKSLYVVRVKIINQSFHFESVSKIPGWLINQRFGVNQQLTSTILTQRSAHHICHMRSRSSPRIQFDTIIT